MADSTMNVNCLLEASDRALEYLLNRLDDGAEFVSDDAKQELCVVYKLPMLLLVKGREKLANQVLDNIKEKFMQSDGDFISYKMKNGIDRKTASGPLAHFWVYMNGWIAMAAHRAGRFDISFPAYNYMKSFYNPDMRSITCSELYNDVTKGKGQEVGIFMTSHVGLTALYFGELDFATGLGDSVERFVANQPNLQEEFFIRMSTDTKNVVREASTPELGPFYSVKVSQPNQLYFLLGYPVIFLCKLFQATQKQHYLTSAEKILDFVLSCDKSMYNFHFSHKVAYGAAMVARETKNLQYKELGEKISQYLLGIQSKDGDFLNSQSVHDNYDQTAEIAIWLNEIYVELSRFRK
ncbi:uncharacterized protein LOC126821413 [Patella vulgata]|uniref:uncharacterized protein LOC126821413 n=1 Tax=Patella vulgata TaxID=6465 RepID=UPI00217FC449|nr:uncharacterized protein LOC126821413 [Patella vulgata]